MDDLFLFLDESGNYDFSVRGTRYLVFACLTTVDPNFSILELYEKKHDFIKKCLPIEYFHASEDKQKVRDEILNQETQFTIKKMTHLTSLRRAPWALSSGGYL